MFFAEISREKRRSVNEMPTPRKYPGLREMIIDAIKRKGPMDMRTLSEFLKIPKSTLWPYVKEMVNDGVLKVEIRENKKGRPKKYYNIGDEIPF